MKNIPFVPYDIFGYLAPGFVLLVLLGLLPEINAFVHQHFYQDNRYTQDESWHGYRQSSVFKNVPIDSTLAALGLLQKDILEQAGRDNSPSAILQLQQSLDLNQSIREKLDNKPLIAKEHFLLKDNMSPAFYLLWIGIAYLNGFVLASISIHFLEKSIVKNRLRKPIINFFAAKRRALLGGYGNALPEPLRTTIINLFVTDLDNTDPTRKACWDYLIDPKKHPLAKKDKKSLAELGKALYYHAYNIALENEVTHSLHERFINLYGFARNVTASLLVSLLVLIIYLLLGREMQPRLSVALGGTYLIMAYFMFTCYLKFYQLSYREIVLAYYHAKKKTAAESGNGK